MNLPDKGTDRQPPAINAGRLKHLEIVQSVISRMASNSFLVKGWNVTLLSAILALALKDKVYDMLWVAFIPNVLFWILDGFFLQQERLFRKHWDTKRSEPQDSATDFSMDTSSYRPQVSSWFGTMFSKTLLIFHGGLFIILVAVVYFVPRGQG